MKKKAVVLLSSGIDSTVNLYAAVKEFEVAMVLTFNYGQRAAKKEIAQSKKIALRLGLNHKLVEIPFVAEFGKSGLIDRSVQVPEVSHALIDDLAASTETAKAVWVPNRNGIFLNIAAGFAESLDADFVIPGFNAEEAATFPDNSGSFLDSLNRSFSFSTANHVKTHCFTVELNKTQIVALGKKLGVPWEETWPCYHGLEKCCGRCESCQRALRALQANQIDTGILFSSNNTNEDA